MSLLAVVFALASGASAEWKEKVLYSFQGGTDGAVPAGGVLFDQQGNLYGATTDGGAATCASIYQCGTVYQMVPPATKGETWTENVLYVFKGNASGDGASPGGGLITDAAGHLYGTTQYGGTGGCILLGTKMGCGTVYEMTPPKEKGGQWKETVIHSFQGGKDGYVPFGDLVFDGVGNLYGATYFGGGKGTTCNPYYQYCGTVFQLSPPKTKGGKWTEKVLYSFKGVAPGAQFGDGANPNGGLVLDSKGATYGTTYIGGYNCAHHSGQGCGTVFRLSPPTKTGRGWTESRIHTFKDGEDGASPTAGVVFGGSDDVCGTTLGGGTSGWGTVFCLRPSSGKSAGWGETILHNFGDSNDGAGPTAGLIFDAHGDIYGTAAVATNRGADGTVFRMRPPAVKGRPWALGVLYTFMGSPDGAYPAAGLVLGKGGALVGTTQEGGSGTGCSFYGCGILFELNP